MPEIREELQQYKNCKMMISPEFKKTLNIGDIIKVVANIQKQEFYIYPDHAKAGNCVLVRFNKRDNGYTVPVRVTRYIELDNNYYISNVLDKENNRIICKQSDVKYQPPKKEIPKRDLYIYEERNKGRTYASIGEDLGIGIEWTRQIYVRTKRKLKSPYYYIKNQD